MIPLYANKKRTDGIAFDFVIEHKWRKPPRYTLETAIVCLVAVVALVAWLIWPM
jgi:hypothetical protein